jgi:hypothetical protein
VWGAVNVDLGSAVVAYRPAAGEERSVSAEEVSSVALLKARVEPKPDHVLAGRWPLDDAALGEVGAFVLGQINLCVW